MEETPRQVIADSQREVEKSQDTVSGPSAEPNTADGNAAALVATRSRHLLIRASAGSGKTYQLALRYLRHVLDGVAPDEVFASTFTRKAAGEILERILLLAADASLDDEKCRKLASHLGVTGLDRQRCRQLLRTLTCQLHRVRVSTLDSFFARLATSYTLELGLPPDWSILDELADGRLRRQAIESVLQSVAPSRIRHLKNLLSKGDAGRRVSSLIQETVDDFYDIYRQTDEDAWQRFPDVAPLSTSALSHALVELRTVDLLDRKSLQEARTKDFEAASSGDWQTFVQKGIGANILKGKTCYNRAEIPPAARKVYAKLLRHAQAILIRQMAEESLAIREILSVFDREYRKLKYRARGLRFDDVTECLAIAYANGQLERPGIDLTHRLDSEVSHLLLDEFQDTSLPQWEAIAPFAERITRSKNGTSLFCVGDVKQAIYGWRGGVSEIFEALDAEFPEVESAPLTCSFRSSQVVIDVVNRLFSQITCHPNLGDDEVTVREWCKAVENHTTAKELPGHVTLESGRPKVDESDCPNRLALVQSADRVQEIVNSAPQAEVGVLVRKNKHVTPLMTLLRDRGIEASEESGNPLTDSAAVMVILSLLKLADHPGDTVARFHVATSPLGPAVGLTWHDDGEKVEDVAASVRRSLVEDGYGQTIGRWARRLAPACNRRDVSRLRQLVDMAYRFEEQATLRTSQFIALAETERVHDPSSAKVRVMNMHQSKGLQFDVVVVPLLGKELVAATSRYVTARPARNARPNLVARYRGKALQRLLPPDFQAAYDATRAASVREELCILYVAVTRAIHALHLVVPASTRNETKLPGSAAGLVRAALTDGKPIHESKILFEHGDPEWPWQTELSGPMDRGDSGQPKVLTVRLAEMSDGRRRGLERVAPSKHGSADRIRLSQLVRSDASSLNRGSLLHAWFEQVEWLDERRPTERQLRGIGQRLGFSGDELDRQFNTFQSMLARPAVVRLLSRRSYSSLIEPPLPQTVVTELKSESFEPEVRTERPVAVRIGGNSLTGTIDRLVLLRRGMQVVAADIIDFKTDSVGKTPAASLERTEHYRRQLKAYKQAISKIHRLAEERIAARLLFTESGEIVGS